LKLPLLPWVWFGNSVAVAAGATGDAMPSRRRGRAARAWLAADLVGGVAAAGLINPNHNVGYWRRLAVDDRTVGRQHSDWRALQFAGENHSRDGKL